MFRFRLFCLLVLCTVAVGSRVAPSSAAEPADPWQIGRAHV